MPPTSVAGSDDWVDVRAPQLTHDGAEDPALQWPRILVLPEPSVAGPVPVVAQQRPQHGPFLTRSRAARPFVGREC